MDLSLTAPGLALLEDGELKEATTLNPKALRGVERLRWIRDQIVDRLPFSSDDPWGIRPDLVAVEGYSYASKGRAVFSLGELGGVVRLALAEREVEWVEIPPAMWRKRLTGKGNLKKEMVGAVLTRKYRHLIGDYYFKSLDEMEAWAVAYAAWLDWRLEPAA